MIGSKDNKPWRLCDTGVALYMAWSAALDQTRPKADKRDILQAEQAYLAHRRACTECSKFIEEWNSEEAE